MKSKIVFLSFLLLGSVFGTPLLSFKTDTVQSRSAPLIEKSLKHTGILQTRDTSSAIDLNPSSRDVSLRSSRSFQRRAEDEATLKVLLGLLSSPPALNPREAWENLSQDDKEVLRNFLRGVPVTYATSGRDNRYRVHCSIAFEAPVSFFSAVAQSGKARWMGLVLMQDMFTDLKKESTFATNMEMDIASGIFIAREEYEDLRAMIVGAEWALKPLASTYQYRKNLKAYWEKMKANQAGDDYINAQTNNDVNEVYRLWEAFHGEEFHG